MPRFPEPGVFAFTRPCPGNEVDAAFRHGTLWDNVMDILFVVFAYADDEVIVRIDLVADTKISFCPNHHRL